MHFALDLTASHRELLTTDGINCAGTDNQKRKYTKHKITKKSNTNKLALVNHKMHTRNLNLNSLSVGTAHVIVHMIVHNCITQYSSQQL